MAANNLTTLADVKIWLGRTDTNSDAVLASLITRASRQILSHLQRPLLLPHMVTEMRTAPCGNVLMLRQFPVSSVASVVTSCATIAQSPTAGWTLDAWDGTPPGAHQALTLNGASFGYGVVTVTYQAGYQVSAEPQTVVSGSVIVAAPYGAWGSDAGVTYANGTMLTQVANNPAIGQYALDATAGTYDFNAGDNGQQVLISYGFIPSDLAQAAIELVSEMFKYGQRIGEKTHSLGGNETVTFDNTRMTPLIESLLQPYRNMIPV